MNILSRGHTIQLVWSKNTFTRLKYEMLTVLALLSNVALYAADRYPVSTISADLAKNANAVVRNQEETFVIHSIDQATYQVRQVVTVLNKNGDNHGVFAVFYDPQRKVKNIQCVVYDASGKVIKKVKNKEIKDVSAFSSFSIYEDNRVKYFDYDPPYYPYTIEYSYELEFDGLLGYPDWTPVTGFGLAVENSNFTVVTPTDTPLRYQLQHSTEPKSWSENGQNWYQWTLEEQHSFCKEDLRPNLGALVPKVLLAPGQFSYEGYAGKQESWNDIGEWINNLNQGRQELPPTTHQEIKNLITGLNDTTEIIRTLYEYMQSKTRYVSIQLGIGGYQPFDASTVDRLGYGDCKALSNYMKSILSVANIESCYTLVNAGSNASDVIAEFPSLQFNHVILGVPLQTDTVWLECTDQTNPFNHLGEFTDDRYVLMVDDSGGKLEKTPSYTKEQNQQIRNIILKLDDSGNGKMSVKTNYTGQLYDGIAYISQLNSSEQEQAAYRKVDIPNFKIEQVQYELNNIPFPVAKEEMTIELSRYASVSGKRWFFNPNVMTQLNSLPAKTENRTYPVVLDQAYTAVDTSLISIPENLHPEFTPETIEITSQFGNYRSEYRIDQGNIIYTRKFQRYKGTFPADSYQELLDFYQEVAKADRQQMVLRKAT